MTTWYCSSELKTNAGAVVDLLDEDLKYAWQEYHAIYAKLRSTRAEANYSVIPKLQRINKRKV